jgi:hypothetical protein
MQHLRVCCRSAREGTAGREVNQTGTTIGNGYTHGSRSLADRIQVHFFSTKHSETADQRVLHVATDT